MINYDVKYLFIARPFAKKAVARNREKEQNPKELICAFSLIFI